MRRHKALPSLLGSLILLVILLLAAWPSPVEPGERERRDAIWWGADRLVQLQNPDGGWSMRGEPGSVRGSRCVVGRALLWASNTTGSDRHRRAAWLAATSLLEILGEEPRSALALDGVFLAEMAHVTGDPGMARAAWAVHRMRRQTHGWNDGWEAAEAYRSPRSGAADPVQRRNLSVWRGLDDVQLAVLVGETKFGREMAEALLRGLELNPEVPGGALAAGRAAEVLPLIPGNPMEPRTREWLLRLRRAQVRPGIVAGDGADGFAYTQDASGALVAFALSRDEELWALARKGASYLTDQQLVRADGQWPVIMVLPRHQVEGARDAAPGVTADAVLALSLVQDRHLRSWRL